MKLEPKWNTMKRPYVFKRIFFELHTNISSADYFIKGAEILQLIYSSPIAHLTTCKCPNVFWGEGKVLLF